jgi:ferredoxin
MEKRISYAHNIQICKNQRVIFGVVSLHLFFVLYLLPPECHCLSTPFGKTAKNVATQILQGTGESVVDLNQYNLDSLSRIEQEWTANMVQKVGENEAGLRLGCKSDGELYVDVVSVVFPRTQSGLGLELVELAGGREDGLGITVVSGLVEGGAAMEKDILPGDSISKVSVVRKQKSNPNKKQAVAETIQEVSVSTECLGYEATVKALQTLPPRTTSSSLSTSSSYDEFYSVLLKRLRRKPKVTIKLQYPPSQEDAEDETIELFAGENLRQGMLIRGVKLNDPLAKRFDSKNGGNCGAGGLCRTCSVSVTSGINLLNPQRLAEKQMLADNPRWRLACKAIVGFGMQEGEMTVRVNPRQW